MMWLLFAVLLVFASHADCGALRCAEGNCTPEEESKAPPIQLSRDELEPSHPPRDAECQPGTAWNSNCHSCRCTEEGLAECVKQPTCDKGSYAPPIRCKPNTTFKKDCNTCVCLPSGHGLCTLMGCVKHYPGYTAGGQIRAKRATRSAVNTTKAIVCVANRMFIKDCNTCWCNEDGTSFYCTRRVCTVPDDGDQEDVIKETQTKLSRKVRAYQPPKQCQPGEVFRLDCNKCLCDNEGQNFSCTRIDCNAVNKYPGGIDNIRAKRDTTAVVRVQCAAGSVFSRECNVCRCSTEGRHAVCTLNVCRDADPRATGRAGPRF